MLERHQEGPVLQVRLNRPDVRNAFNDELIAALLETFTSLPADVRAVVISGEGETFCAGGDLQWMRKAAGYTVEQNVEDALRLAHLFEAIASCRPIVVARVHGAAFGGGAGLVAAADVAVAAQGTKFSFSEVKLGLVAATISPFVIPKIGAGHARALFATGEIFDAERALRIGLVHDTAPVEELDAAVERKLKAILMAGPEAAFVSKSLAQRPPMELAAAARLLAETRAGDEAREGIAAFLEKRKASFVVER